MNENVAAWLLVAQMRNSTHPAVCGAAEVLAAGLQTCMETIDSDELRANGIKPTGPNAYGSFEEKWEKIWTSLTS